MKKKNNLFLYDGSNSKALHIESDWDELINTVKGGGGNLDPYSTSAWYYSCVQKRASMTRAIPKRIMGQSGEVDENDLQFDVDIGDLFYRSSIALDRYAAAYWGKIFSGGGSTLAGVKWLDPTSVKPIYSPEYGLVAFDRRGKPIPYDRESDSSPLIGWVWLLGMDELKPAMPPEDIAKLPASILASGDEVLAEYYKRGAIAQHWITADWNPDPVTKEDLITRIRRVLFGGTGTSHAVEVFGEGLKVNKIGAEPSEFFSEPIDTSNKVDVGAVLETPRLIINPDAAANRAVMDRVWMSWIEYTIVPHAQRIATALNKHIFEPYAGLELELNPAAMTINQEEERSKAQAFALYVGNGVPHETAAALLGIDVPDGMSLTGGVAPEAQNAPAVGREPEDAIDELQDDLGEAKALEMAKLRRYVARGKHLERPFVSDILTPDEIAKEVGSAAYAPFRYWQGYP